MRYIIPRAILVRAKITFGPYQVDPVGMELFKNGTRIRLQEQPFRILLTLMERPGEVVTRDELKARAWSDGTYVDFDQSLNKAVNRLREVLCDEPSQPRYIETVPRRGYRFIAHVENQAEKIDTVAPAPEEQAVQSKTRIRWPLWVIGFSLAAIVGGVIHWRMKPTPESHPAFDTIPFTAYPGWETHPSFSPDGKVIAFAWNGEEQSYFHIYIKQVDGVTPLRLTNSAADDLSPSFSPDGRFVGFIRADGQKASFVLVPSLGGPERVVTTLTADLPWGIRSGCNIFSWLPDGQHIVANGLELVDVESGEKTSLTFPVRKYNIDKSPAVSPDGRSIAFERRSSPAFADLWALTLDDHLRSTGALRQITRGWKAINYFCLDAGWTSDGHDLVFANGFDMWRVNASGAESPKLLFSPGLTPVISAANHTLAFVLGRGKVGLIRLALQTPGHHSNNSVEFAASTQGEQFPQYSPDGRQVSFESVRTGELQIWLADADGSNQRPLPTAPNMRGESPKWSPDGRFLAFDSPREGPWHIYTIPSTGGQWKRLTSGDADHNLASWSHDGKWIYFTSPQKESFQIWKIPSAGGTAIQVTKHGGYASAESADGQTLFFTKEEWHSGLWRISLPDGPEELMIPDIASRNFAVTSRGVYYVLPTQAGGKSIFKYLDFENTTTTLIATVQGELGDGISVSPDGRYLLYTNWVTSMDIQLVKNFH